VSSINEISYRYGQALYEIAKESQNLDVVLNELRVLKTAFSETSVVEFFKSPIISKEEKFKIINKIISQFSLSESVKNFIFVLSDKDRLPLLPFIANSFESISDKEHKVIRGVVRSATMLSPEQRKSIEKKVEDYTKKKVILSYEVDKSVIGGLVAEVGSFTFDDTITTHLRRLKEDLNRSRH
jgi:F-type H+-transporting ATPase subunit delta